ncbi:MAG: ferrous iron transport protein B [Promethearchaeota archaeon]
MSKNLALIGNPNVGKTVVFNELTGQTGHVANWPGVTVEKKTGKMDKEFDVIDLPGVYSLSPSAIDEMIARNFIVNDKPDIIVDILDATNLERNLYLAFLLKELEVPIIYILNLMDAAKKRNIEVDVDKLAELLGSPVIPTVAIKGEGIDAVKTKIRKIFSDGKLAQKSSIPVKFSKEIEDKIQRTEELLKKDAPHFLSDKRRWVAIKLLEQDKEVIKEISVVPNGIVVVENVKRFASGSEEFDLAGERYNIISEIIDQTYKRDKDMITTSDILDKIFLHKFFGIPIFLMIMWAMFEFTFRVSAPLGTLVEIALGALGNLITMVWPEDAWYTSFVLDGIIGGFGAVLGFVPLIFTMFLALSFLEDSGYLARAAFNMDRLMYKLGLHGRSFVSLMLGFGCNIPAVMSCRAIESEEDRLTTILVNQNISCGARLPVYVLLGGFILGKGATGTIIFSLYLLGIVIAILMALFFKKVIFRGETAPFILELGDYRMPTVKYTGIHMWERGREFIKKAGMIIFTVVVLMWVFQNIGVDPETGLLAWGIDPENSLLAGIGHLFQPLFAPLRWSWIAVVGIVFGFLAKEVVVAAFGLILAGEGEPEGLGKLVVGNLAVTGVAAAAMPALVYGYLVFVLLYTPCVAHIGAVYKETGSKKWTLVSATYGIGLGYSLALLINLIGGVYF